MRIFTIWLLFSAMLIAQTTEDTVFFPMRISGIPAASLSFTKQLNMYTLSGMFTQTGTAGGIFYGAENRYQSTVIRSNGNSIKDDNLLQFFGGTRLSETFSIGLSGRHQYLSDNRNVQLNSAEAASASIFTVYQPLPSLIIVPMLGYTSNSQSGEEDDGLLYGVEGDISGFKIASSRLTGFARFRNEDISPRKTMVRNLNASLVSPISDQIDNAFSFQFTQGGRDFYFFSEQLAKESIRNKLQRRVETRYRIQDELLMHNLFMESSLLLRGAVEAKNIDRDTRNKDLSNQSPSVFDTKIDEFSFDLEAAFLRMTEDSYMQGKIVYTERNEKHLTKSIEGVMTSFYDERAEAESRKNNLSKRIMLSFSSVHRFSASDTLEISGMHMKLQYDTPSKDNFDDRDELLTILRIRYLRQITPFLALHTFAEGNLSTINYLFKERSSNNNSNKILRLQAGTLTTIGAVQTYNAFEVSANYTVYEYEDINPNYRSYSLRQFSYLDSTKISFTPNFYLKVQGYIKLTEQGDLDWKAFSMKPNREVEEYLLVPQLFTEYRRWTVGIGMRYFALNTYRLKKEDKALESSYRSVGPSATVFYSTGNDITMYFTGWYEFIDRNVTTIDELITVNFSFRWQF